MTPDEIKRLLAGTFPDAHIDVDTDGYHFNLLVVSDSFAGLTPVKKQQLVYAAIGDRIADGSMHAVNMKLYTRAQWQTAQNA
ncbi:MAG TPA: BolA family protein [Pseudomonadales bacterium]